MAIDFETEEKSRRWIYILPIMLLSLALAVTLWGYLSKSSELKELDTDHRLTTMELEKFRDLYSSTASSVKGTEFQAELADSKLQECLRSNIELQDQITALELGQQAGVQNSQ